jgi:hypothetical protein
MWEKGAGLRVISFRHINYRLCVTPNDKDGKWRDCTGCLRKTAVGRPGNCSNKSFATANSSRSTAATECFARTTKQPANALWNPTGMCPCPCPCQSTALLMKNVNTCELETRRDNFCLSQLTFWNRSSSKCYLRIQSVPQREHYTSPLQRSTG